jgi:uncharacterized protein with beta-barrel porin domain
MVVLVPEGGAHDVTRKTIGSSLIGLAMLGAALGAARAQSIEPPPRLESVLASGAAATVIGATAAAFDLGTRFLYNSSGQGGIGELAHMFGSPNPNGGGADPQPASRYRAWTEGYGLQSRNDPVANIPGDKRHSQGGVVGVGMLVAPGITLNASVDQSHTNIDVTGLPQQGKYDLTQVGMSGAIESGAWTLSGALVRGVAQVTSTRDVPSGPATANYDGDLWGALADISYYVALGRLRIVPRVGTDWLRSHTDAYSEVGGLLPANVPALTISRTRIFAGGQIGNFWMIDKTMFDISGYGRVVDVVSYSAPPFFLAAASGFAIGQTIQPPTESRWGYETGATASLRISPQARLYATYDVRFRGGFESQGGSIGCEFRW